MHVHVQLFLLGYDLETEGCQALDEPNYECGHCGTRTMQPTVVGHITLTVSNGGPEHDVWTKAGWVSNMVPRPASEWGEPHPPERQAIECLLDEWVGKRYRAVINVHNSRAYVCSMDQIISAPKKRRGRVMPCTCMLQAVSVGGWLAP